MGALKQKTALKSSKLFLVPSPKERVSGPLSFNLKLRSAEAICAVLVAVGVGSWYFSQTKIAVEPAQSEPIPKVAEKVELPLPPVEISVPAPAPLPEKIVEPMPILTHKVTELVVHKALAPEIPPPSFTPVPQADDAARLASTLETMNEIAAPRMEANQNRSHDEGVQIPPGPGGRIFNSYDLIQDTNPQEFHSFHRSQYRPCTHVDSISGVNPRGIGGPIISPCANSATRAR